MDQVVRFEEVAVWASGGLEAREGVILEGSLVCFECEGVVGLGERFVVLREEGMPVGLLHVGCLPGEAKRARRKVLGWLKR